MTSFIKCQYEYCNNITTDYKIDYGAYCFKHNRLTLCNPSIANKIYLATPYPRVKTPIRKPLSPKKITEPVYQKIKCMLCETEEPQDYKMKCGHFVCEDCITSFKTLRCPSCKEIMEGPVMNPKIKKMIEKRINESILKKEATIYKIKDNTNEELEL
jgi:late competence protein required for DNA uptake (superfamily II DNA/RNA helicase)